MDARLREALKTILELDTSIDTAGTEKMSDEELLSQTLVYISKQIDIIAHETQPDNERLKERSNELKKVIVDKVAGSTVWEILQEIFNILF